MGVEVSIDRPEPWPAVGCERLRQIDVFHASARDPLRDSSLERSLSARSF
jgi:hypothetical protein